MLTTTTIRNTLLKRWSARAWVNGQPVVLVGDLPARTMSSLYARSTCQLSVRDAPPAAGLPVTVDLMLEGAGSVRFFMGTTADSAAAAESGERTVHVVDILDLDKPVGTAITWNSRSYPDAVRDLLHAAGIADTQIDSIANPGSTYALGPVYAIQIEASETVKGVFDELMAFGGMAAYVTPTGRIRVVADTGIPASTSAIVYAESATAGEYPIFDARISIEGNETATNVFTATGPKRPDGALPDATFTASVPGKPARQSYRFAQSDTVCAAIAQREVSRRARKRRTVILSVPLDPFILPGDTVLVRVARINYAAPTPAYVLDAKTGGDGAMDLTVSIGPSLVDGYSSSIQPPNVDFSMTVEHQLVTLDGVPVASYLVQCQDISRDRAGYAIESRSWEATGTDVSPESSSDEAPIFLFTDLSGAEISLTVTSASGESATITREPVANAVEILSRIVSVACGADGWKILADTSGWRIFVPPGEANCTAVPPICESPFGLYAGFSGGTIYRTTDALATMDAEAMDVVTFGEAIACMWVNETDPAHILAAHGDTIERSIDAGSAWSTAGTAPADINDIQSSPGNANEIRACAGDALYISYDGGETWGVTIQGIEGSEATAMAMAPWGHAAVFEDVGSALASAVLFEEGYTVDWSGVASEDLPTGLSSITPLLEEEGFIVGETNDLVRDGALPALAFSAGSGRLYKLLWDGAQFVATLIGPATSSGAGKLIGLEQHYEIESSSATQIGYGPLAAPIIPLGLILIGNAGGVWVWGGASWERRDTGLPAGWQWSHVAVSPLNPATDWIVAGYTTGGINRTGGYLVSDGQPILWRTQDAGTSWVAVPMADASGEPDPFIGIGALGGIGYLDNGQIYAVGRYGYGPWYEPHYSLVLWRGTSSLSPSVLLHDSGNTLYSACAGMDGEVVLAYGTWVWTTSASHLGYVRSGASTITQGATISEGLHGTPITRLNPTSRAIAVGGGSQRVSLDYRNGVLSDGMETGGYRIAGINGAIYTTANGTAGTGQHDGLKRIVDPLGLSYVEDAVASESRWNVVASDPAMQRGAALYGGYSTPLHVVYSTDGGTTWVDITAPSEYDQNRSVVGVF